MKHLFTLILTLASFAMFGQVTILFEDFEGAVNQIYQGNTTPVSINGLTNWEFVTTQAGGRLQTQVGVANSGSKSMTLDDNGCCIDPKNEVRLTHDMSAFTLADSIELNFWALHNNDENDLGDRVWIRGSNVDPWIEVVNLAAIFNSGNDNIWLEFTVDVDAALQANGQVFTNTFQVSFGQEDNSPFTGGDGHIFDDVSLLVYQYGVNFTNANTTVCFNEVNGFAVAEAILGAPPYNYVWSTGATTDSIGGLAPGTYCVTATDANGDTTSNCITIEGTDSIFSSATITTPLICKYDISEVSLTASGGDPLTEAYLMDTTSANYNWDSSGTCTSVFLPGSVTGLLDIGFDFEFYGNSYDQFQIARNGYIGFGGGLDDGCCSGEPVPHNSAFEPDNAIFAAWFDVDGGEITYCLSGEAPFRRLIVNFLALGDNTIDDNYTGQIILHETTNCIEIQTEYMQYGGYYNQFDDVTQGITNDGSTLGQAYPGRNADEGGASGGWEADSSYVRFCPVDSTGLAYLWSNGYVGNTAYGLEPGTYTVSATDVNGCSSFETVVIDPATSNLTLNPVLSDISCFGFNDGMIETDQTGGINPISYTWSSGQTSADIASLIEGNYSVVAEDAVGCLDSVNGMMIQEPELLVSNVYFLQSTQCPKDENGSIGIVIDGGVEPYDVVWNNGQVGPIASNLPAGSYQATITDSSGCQAFQSAVILAEFNSPNVDLGANITQTAGGTVTLNAGPQSAYLWNTGATSQTIQAALTGVYWVEVYNGNGCSASDSIYIEIWPTGINDIADDAKFALYPNPTSSNLMLNLEGMESASDLTVRIVNIQGQIVMEKVLNTISSAETVELDVNSFAPGMYNLSLTSDAFNAVKSFVKQ